MKLLQPYSRLKEDHIKTALEIEKTLEGKFSIEKFLKACELVDKFKDLNYSKKRKNTSRQVEQFLRKHNLFPRND